jgi:hypothetical protein
MEAEGIGPESLRIVSFGSVASGYGAGAENRTRTLLRGEGFEYERKGRRINALLIRCPFSFPGVTRSALQSEDYGHPRGHLTEAVEGVDMVHSFGGQYSGPRQEDRFFLAAVACTRGLGGPSYGSDRDDAIDGAIFVKHCLQEFRSLMSGFEPEVLETCSHAIYGVWADGTLAYLNPGWFAFARANNGDEIGTRWGLGASVFDATADALRPFYRQHFTSCVKQRAPWSHEYDCSSAQILRRFHMLVYPLGDGGGLLVVNSLLLEQPHDAAGRTPLPPEEGLYRNEHGLVAHCVHCRRFRRLAPADQWDWVPAWVERLPKNTTGGLCGPCITFHYPGAKFQKHD